MTALEDIMIPVILGLIIGPAGFMLIHQAVLAVDFSTWMFTGHVLAAHIAPFIEWIWLINCIFIAGYQFWENK
jgi:hypothetical protein